MEQLSLSVFWEEKLSPLMGGQMGLSSGHQGSVASVLMRSATARPVLSQPLLSSDTEWYRMGAPLFLVLAHSVYCGFSEIAAKHARHGCSLCVGQREATYGQPEPLSLATDKTYAGEDLSPTTFCYS